MNFKRCFNCKYNVVDWCKRRAAEVGDVVGGVHCCVECPMNLNGDNCHCLTVNNADECDRFEPIGGFR